MKVTIEQIEATLREQKIDPKVIIKIVNDLEAAAQEEKADRAATGKRPKSQFVLLSTTLGLGYALQVEAEAAPTEILPRIQAAATDFNQSKRGRKVPVSTVGEALEHLPAKWFKTTDGKKLAVKTRQAVPILTVPNALAL
jgi:hypothetical protein